MPPQDDSVAVIREYTDSHGGTVVDVTTTDEFRLREKTVTPGLKTRIVKPDSNSEGLSQVTVEAIPKAHISTLNKSDWYLKCILSKRRSTLIGILSRPEKHITKTVMRSNTFPTYDGPYVADPSAHGEVVLQTSGLLMNGNVVVNKIYYSEVSNLSNGMTVYIAEH